MRSSSRSRSRTVFAAPAQTSRRHGVSALEFVMVLPVMVMILAGTGDYCRFASTSIAVCNAARGGAGYGCMQPFDTYTESRFLSTCRARVEEEFSGVPGFDPARLSVSISREGTAPTDRIRVTVTYPFETVIHWAFLPSSIPIQRTSVLPMIR